VDHETGVGGQVRRDLGSRTRRAGRGVSDEDTMERDTRQCETGVGTELMRLGQGSGSDSRANGAQGRDHGIQFRTDQQESRLTLCRCARPGTKTGVGFWGISKVLGDLAIRGSGSEPTRLRVRDHRDPNWDG
jgi:hypothetical protein